MAWFIHRISGALNSIQLSAATNSELILPCMWVRKCFKRRVFSKADEGSERQST